MKVSFVLFLTAIQTLLSTFCTQGFFVTQEEVHVFKSLASYKYFVLELNGSWMLGGSNIITQIILSLDVGKVCHSYSSKTPLRPWEIIKSSGSVVCGHCMCMAGQGKICSHVGAVLYWLWAHVRIRNHLP